MDHLCYYCLVFVMLSRVLVAALWAPAGKWLISWLLFVMFKCVLVTFPCGILGQVWYWIVLIPGLCHLYYFSYFVLPPPPPPPQFSRLFDLRKLSYKKELYFLFSCFLKSRYSDE